MKLVDKLTHARLVELLEYNSSTGIFTWKKKSHPKSKVRPGDKAGCVGISRNGIPYKYVGIDKVNYKTARLAWFYVHGEWPRPEVDHKDNDSLNDAIDNLRVATSLQNQYNTRRHRDKVGGLPKGVRAHRGKYQALISVSGKQVVLGSTFATPLEASDAYAEAAAKYHGEFARVS